MTCEIDYNYNCGAVDNPMKYNVHRVTELWSQSYIDRRLRFDGQRTVSRLDG